VPEQLGTGISTGIGQETEPVVGVQRSWGGRGTEDPLEGGAPKGIDGVGGDSALGALGKDEVTGAIVEGVARRGTLVTLGVSFQLDISDTCEGGGIKAVRPKLL